MAQVTRREFSQQALGSLLTYSLLETLCAHDAFADGRAAADGQVAGRRQRARAAQVRGQKLPQVAWQEQIEKLFCASQLARASRADRFRSAHAGNQDGRPGGAEPFVQVPEVEGLPTEYVFGKQIFALKQGRSVVPHGHNNMATAFLVLKGDLRGRHYDRLEDLPDAYIIKPTIDRKFTPGECSTVSDHKDNVHWFQALTEPAFIFNIHVFNVSPGLGQPTGRVYLNPLGEKLAGGKIKAPHIDYHTSVKLFG